MSDVFYVEQPSNFFDSLVVDVKKLYKEYPFDQKVDARPNFVPVIQSRLHRLYRSPLLPLRYRERLWSLARQINLDITWFREFTDYWISVLHGRTLLGVYDFFFLKNLYRVKFQRLQVPDTLDAQTHLTAWQRPEVLFQLFHLTSRNAYLNQLPLLHYLFQFRKTVNSVLEFGCATAPITFSFFEFYRPRTDLTFYIADIQTLAFHFGAYRFRHCSNVKPVLLLPENDFMLHLDDTVDAIFCITVFEHLNQPLETIKRFHRFLNPGGLLFFDYIKSDAEGLDTAQGVRERDSVLDYVAEHFTVLLGELTKDRSMGLTIVQKRD